MDRRKAIAALGGIVATSALLARPAAAQQTAPAPIPGSGEAITSATYKPRTLTAGTTSKMGSQLAASLAQHPKVREFAQFEVDEQTAIAQVLTDDNNPPPAPLTAKDQATITKLHGLQGKAFDAAYVQSQIEGHRELLAIQQGFLNGPVTNRDQEHIAVLARTVIMMHLTMLQGLQQTLAA